MDFEGKQPVGSYKCLVVSMDEDGT